MARASQPLQDMGLRGHVAANSGRRGRALLPAVDEGTSRTFAPWRGPLSAMCCASGRVWGTTRERAIFCVPRWLSMADYAGVLPSDPHTLRRLPGIGQYTAGAIASIAFGLDEPALDANIRRVLARVFNVTTVHQLQFDRETPLAAGGRESSQRKSRELHPGADGLGRRCLPAQATSVRNLPRRRAMHRPQERDAATDPYGAAADANSPPFDRGCSRPEAGPRVDRQAPRAADCLVGCGSSPMCEFQARLGAIVPQADDSREPLQRRMGLVFAAARDWASSAMPTPTFA